MENSERFIILMKNVTKLVEKYGNILEKKENKELLKQKEDDICDYPVINNYFRRKNITTNQTDRVVPISTELINDYNQKTGSKIEKAEVRYGPNSDQLMRDYHANALTLGMAIYMNSRSYKPENEEGRKTLFHELTHIKQNQEDILEGQKTVEELENEAEATEISAETINEKYKIIEVNGKKYKVTKSTYKKIMEDLKERIDTWLEEQESLLSEEEYLELLLKYEKIESEYRFPWQQN